MNPVQWWTQVEELRRDLVSAEQFDVPSRLELSARRTELEKIGSVLVQPSNPALGDAFLRRELDPGLLIQTLRKSISLSYMDPDEASLCQEISDLRTRLDMYVVQFIGATGWTLGDSHGNTSWLYHALEHPLLVDKHPRWFEDVVEEHPWAWRIAFTEQFYASNAAPCRKFLYDKTQEPWANIHTVEKMLCWLHCHESKTPEKAVMATQAWPKWMDHLRNYSQMHYQLLGVPKGDGHPNSVWATRYFQDMATLALEHWKPIIYEPLECGSLLADEP